MIEAIRYFHASSLVELEQMMPALITAGWQPAGTLSVDPSQGGWDFYQTMVKGESTSLPSNMAAVTDGLFYPLYGSDGTTDQAVSVSPVVISSRADRFKLPASAAVVKNGDTVSVRNSAGANGKGSSAVVTAAGAVTGINLPAATAMLDNSAAVTVQSSSGTVVNGTHTAAVSSGVLSNIRLDAGIAPVASSASVTIQNSAGVSVPGTHTSTVSVGVLQNVRLAATIAPVNNGDAITMQNSAGAAIAGTHSATVATGAVSNVKLAATIAPVANAAVQASVPVTNNAILAIGTVNRQVTYTVANGVVTGLTIV